MHFAHPRRNERKQACTSLCRQARNPPSVRNSRSFACCARLRHGGDLPQARRWAGLPRWAGQADDRRRGAGPGYREHHRPADEGNAAWLPSYLENGCSGGTSSAHPICHCCMQRKQRVDAAKDNAPFGSALSQPPLVSPGAADHPDPSSPMDGPLDQGNELGVLGVAVGWLS